MFGIGPIHALQKGVGSEIDQLFGCISHSYDTEVARVALFFDVVAGKMQMVENHLLVNLARRLGEQRLGRLGELLNKNALPLLLSECGEGKRCGDDQ